MKAKVLVPPIGNLASMTYFTTAGSENILAANAAKDWLTIKPGANVVEVSHSVDGTFNITVTKHCAKKNRKCNSYLGGINMAY